MERFEDLMGITHDTGDAFLDKKLNQNTAYIGLGAIAAGAGIAGILGKKSKVKEYGGDFAKAIRPYATQGLEDLQDIYAQGPRIYEGERVVGFDPLQTRAQTGILNLLGTTDPYTQRQEQLLGQAVTGLGGLESRLGEADIGIGRGVGFLEDFRRGVGRAEEGVGVSRGLLTDFQTGLGRTEESLGRGLGFLEDFRSQADVAASRLGEVDPGLARTEALLAESAQRQRDAARGVGLGGLDIDKYRSDYMTAVADPALADIERQLQKDIRQLGAQEAQYGQGRGSRGAILEAELRGAAGRSRADILGQVGKEAYQSALATAQQQQQAQYGADVADIERQARAAEALAGLGQAEQAAAIGGRGTLAGMYGDVAGRSLAGATQAGDITRQLGDITSQRLAAVSQSDALTSQLAGLAGQRLGAAGQAAGLTGQALDIARAGGMIPGMYADIAGQFGQLGESAFGRRRTELEALAGIGEERRSLEQERKRAELAKFAEEDPMAFTERYLQTIYAAPTTGVQRIQKPSGLQQALGVVTALTGAAQAGAPIPGFGNTGGRVGRFGGGGIAALTMGGNTSKKYKLSTEGKLDKTMTVEDLAKALESSKVKEEVQEKFKEDSATVAPASDNSAMQGGDQTPTEFGQGQIDPKPLAAADNSRMFANQALARQLMMQRLGAYGMKNTGGGIAQLQEGGVPVGKPGFNKRIVEGSSQEDSDGQPNAFSRIMSSVGSGLRSVASDFMSPVKYYSENLDPFRGYDGYDRMRIGLSILATQPELGESSLGSISRGALAGVQAAAEDRLEREDTGTKSVGTFSDSEFMNIAERFFKQQNISGKQYASKLDELIRQSKLEALNLAQQGLLSGTGSAFLRQAGEDIFRDKLKGLINIPDDKPVDNSKSKRTGMNRAARGTPAARGNLEDF
jgi:hypothetical protein